MNITILANRDLAANVVVDGLVTRLADHRLSVVLSQRVGAAEGRPPALIELQRHEQDLLRTLIEPFAERTPGPVRPFPALARAVDGRLVAVDRPRSPAGRAALLAEAPDLLLSVRYGGILDAEHVAAVPHGILNLHSGRLPDYRGILASLRAVIAGDAELACTVHRIVDAGIDTGPVIGAATVPFDRDRSLLWNLLALYEPGLDLLIDAVRRIDAGDALLGTPQDPDAGAYFGLPDEAALAAFAATGARLTDLGDTLELLRRHFLRGAGVCAGESAGDGAGKDAGANAT